MRLYHIILILLSAFALSSCVSEKRPQTPFETLVAYTQAIKKKDAPAMKELLSADSIKMARDEATEQKVSLDEIISKETLFGGDRTTVEFRNEKIEGDRATIEMKDSAGLWNMVRFIKEEGIWKIDKKAFADELIKQADEDNRRLDEQINRDRQQ